MERLYYSIVFLKRLGIAVLLFSLLRIVFILFNMELFSSPTIMVFIGGLVFDFAAIAYVYLPFIFASILPLPFRTNSRYQKFLKVLFYVSTVITIILSLIDVIYYRFTFKRSTADFFDMITTGDDTLRLIPQFFIDYYYMVILAVCLGLLVAWLYRKTQLTLSANFKWWRATLEFITWLSLAVIASRGGIQLRPISAMEASKFSAIEQMPLVLNTPFTISRTLFKSGISPKSYFEDDEVAAIYNPVKSFTKNGDDQPNIVLIILESFSKEYIGFYNKGNGFTPFLDSLMAESVVFENAYANGKKSIEALPSLLAGIPSLMDAPYATSTYNNNSINGVGSLLSELGYNSSFYHGGANGTMNFDAFTQVAGIDNYYGRDEYPKENSDYDGNWGIFDEPYLLYFAKELNKKTAPFFSAVFTLSSHHPYTIPEKYSNRFPKGKLPIHESIGYTDHALKQFFKSAQSMPWFENTTFIITADHTAQIANAAYMNRVGFFRIPLIIVNSRDSASIISSTTQQTDVLPYILNAVNYEGNALLFGNNPLKDDEHFAVNYLNGVYQLITDEYSYLSDGENTVGMYDLKTDPYQLNDIKNSKMDIQIKLDTQLKAILQQYTNRMIKNELSIKK